STSTTTQPSNTSTSPPKRRRISRACDVCRKRKVKCDGKQPCTHCMSNNLVCTYNRPSNRQKRLSLKEFEVMKRRLREVETLIDSFTEKRDGDNNSPPSTLHDSDHQVQMNNSYREANEHLEEIVRSLAPENGTHFQNENANEGLIGDLSGGYLLQNTTDHVEERLSCWNSTHTYFNYDNHY
ncbi:BgTH12-03475, partial [Blumeria graminis f. sp. triticale]